jgi:hypothetical protein
MTSVGQEGEKFSPSTRANSIASAGSAPVAAGFQLATEVGEYWESDRAEPRSREQETPPLSGQNLFSALCGLYRFFFRKSAGSIWGSAQTPLAPCHMGLAQ